MPTFQIRRSSSSMSGSNADKWRQFTARLRDGYQRVTLTDQAADELNRTGLVDLQKLSDADDPRAGGEQPGGNLAPDELDALRLGLSQLGTLIGQAETSSTLLAMRDTLTVVLPLMERYVG